MFGYVQVEKHIDKGLITAIQNYTLCD